MLAPWRSRRSRALAAVLAVSVAGGLYAVFHVVPIEVERRLNKTAPPAKPVAPSARATDLHRRLTVVDLHADSLLWGRDLLARGDRGHVDVPRLIEGNVALQALTLVTKTPRHQNIDSNPDDSDVITWLAIAEGWPPRTWTDRTERALHQAEVLDGFARRSDGRLTLVRTVRDLRAYLARREREPEITAAWLGVEGAQALGGDLANLDRLFAAGVRMMAPTHFSDNDVGGSASGEEKPGLTEMGRELVRRMERGGMIVDLAHASARTIDDVLAIATRPVVVSHTGVRGTCDNARNLGDDQLRAIAATGGVIGIGYWPHAVCSADVGAIVRAVRHAVEVAGVDHVALGSDFDGSTTTPFDASGVVALTSALVDEGFDDDDIEKIIGKNTLRVLLEALPP